MEPISDAGGGGVEAGPPVDGIAVEGPNVEGASVDGMTVDGPTEDGDGPSVDGPIDVDSVPLAVAFALGDAIRTT